MLMLKSTCGINLHQYVIRHVGGNYATVDFMHDLYVCIDCYDWFVWCISGGVFCWTICWIVIKSSTSLEVSLYIFYHYGLKSLLSQYA